MAWQQIVGAVAIGGGISTAGWGVADNRWWMVVGGLVAMIVGSILFGVG